MGCSGSGCGEDSIESHTLLENQRLLLMFPGKGIIPLKILQKDYREYLYEELGPIGADEWKSHARLDISAENVDNLLEVKNKDRVYQVFYGISPSALRAYLGYPLEQSRGELDTINVASKSKFGYIDGFKSPIDNPSPDTELFIPYNLDVGFGWYNPLTYGIPEPRIDLRIYRYKTKLIKDVELISNLLSGRYASRIATLGGLTSFSYDHKDVWGINPIPLGSTSSQISNILGGR